VIKSRRIGWAGNVGCLEEKKGANRDLMARPKKKRPLG
jgi:hypothetical protein